MYKILILAIMVIYSSNVNAKVEVVDGDSLVQYGQRIRMQGIDAPEYFQTCKDNKGQKYNCGKKSRKYLSGLILNKKVICDCEAQLDRYKRKLCECFVGRMSLNRQMIRQGWAVTYRSNKYKKDENLAKEEKLGIWQGRFIRPALYRSLEREYKKKR